MEVSADDFFRAQFGKDRGLRFRVRQGIETLGISQQPNTEP